MSIGIVMMNLRSEKEMQLRWKREIVSIEVSELLTHCEGLLQGSRDMKWRYEMKTGIVFTCSIFGIFSSSPFVSLWL